MNKILVGCPVLYNGDTCLKAFRSVIDEADLLIIDNNSNKDVKQAIMQIWSEKPNVKVITNKVNNYVNASWCQIIKYFLDSDYEQIVIMNSDLIMQHGWGNYLEDGVISLPCDGTLKQDEEVFTGSPGIFLQMNKTMAKMIYPIPEEIKLWYGDEYLLTILRQMGYKTIVKHKLVGLHYNGGSQTIGILPDKAEMIEQDKIAWENIVKPLMIKRINEERKKA